MIAILGLADRVCVPLWTRVGPWSFLDWPIFGVCLTLALFLP